MSYYIYEIKRNGILEHTSGLFSSLKAAYDYFMKQDAPNHYGKMKFIPSSAVSSALVNKSTRYSVMEDTIRVQFKKVESKPVPYGEWSDLCEKENMADE
jgi:hypothetical protein